MPENSGNQAVVIIKVDQLPDSVSRWWHGYQICFATLI